MKFWRDLSIRFKLGLLLSIAVCGLLGFAVISFLTLKEVRVGSRLSQNSHLITEVAGEYEIPRLSPLPSSPLNSYAQQSDSRDEVKQYAAQIHANRLYMEEGFAHLQNEPLPAGVRKELDTAHQSAEAWFDVTEQQFYPALESGQRAAAEDLRKGIMRSLFEQNSASCIRLQTLTDAWSAENDRTSNAIVRSSFRSMIVAGVLALILVLVLGIVITKGFLLQLGGEPTEVAEIAGSLARGDLRMDIPLRAGDSDSLMASMKSLVETMRRIAARADAIGKGDLDVELEILSEHDTLGQALNKMTTMLRRAKAEDARHNWLQQGGGQLSAALTGDYSQQRLAEIAISVLGRYLDAGRGVLYIYRHNERALDLLGSYMYSERTNLGSRFLEGEGAVGQVARERKPILLTMLANDAPPIVTGTTCAAPLYTYTYPLLSESELLGVLELASFQRYDALQMEFLETATHVIASFLHIAAQRDKIGTLLTATEASEKEARAANQRLIDVNATMEAQQQQLHAQTRDLQHSNAQMEEQQQQLQQQTEELQMTNAQMEEQQQQLQMQTEELKQSNTLLQEQQQLLEQRNRDLQEAQHGLDAKARQLEVSGQYKTDFLANMSHELRTPLNSIILLSKMMAMNEQGKLGVEEVKRSEVIHRSGQDLLRLINDVLDLSKVEAGKMELTMMPVASEELSARFRETFEHAASAKGLSFIVEDRLRGEFTTDVNKVTQILDNLVSNALKFTKEGTVTLGFYRDAGLKHPVRIVVRDTGIGIAPEKRTQIFEAFQQADGSTSREYGGTGLGLTISLRLAQLLGGTIELQTTPGQGSEFSLLLPDRDASQESSRAGTRPEVQILPHLSPSDAVEDDRKALRPGDSVVLLIDDDMDFGRFVVAMNRRLGYKTVVASTGTEGLALARHYRPQGILLDLSLPDMDGAQVLHAIKTTQTIASTPIYVVSARDRDEAMLDKDIVGYLQKPAEQEFLTKAVQQVLSSAAKGLGEAILVVESGGITAATITRIAGTKFGPIQAATRGASLKTSLALTPCRLAIIDMHGLTIDESLEVAQSIRSAYAEADMVFYAAHAVDAADEARLRPYSDSIIVHTTHAERRLLENMQRFLLEVPKPHTRLEARQESEDSKQRIAGKRILVVDDDPRNLYVITAALEQQGAKVDNATNGKSALAFLAATSVDLIIMDVMMPEMDGNQTIAALRALPALAQIPVVALTAKAQASDRATTLAVGANDYLTKPVDYASLIDSVAKLCEKAVPNQ